jgi:hypothetical protein
LFGATEAVNSFTGAMRPNYECEIIDHIDARRTNLSKKDFFNQAAPQSAFFGVP